MWEKILEVITKSLEADEIPTVKDCLRTTRHKMKDDWTRSKTSWNPIVATTYKTLELDEPLNVGDTQLLFGHTSGIPLSILDQQDRRLYLGGEGGRRLDASHEGEYLSRGSEEDLDRKDIEE